MNLSEKQIEELKLTLAALYSIEGIFANIDQAGPDKIVAAKFLGMTTSGIAANKLSRILGVDKSQSHEFIEEKAMSIVQSDDKELDEDQLSFEPVGINYIRLKHL